MGMPTTLGQSGVLDVMRRRITALRSPSARSSSYREPAAFPAKVSWISRVVQTVWKSDLFGFCVRMLSLIRPLVNDIELVSLLKAGGGHVEVQ